MSGPELAALRDFLDDNLRKGFIRPSRSPVGAPSFFVKKKGTTQLRLVVDYKNLNANTISDSYPLPLIPEMLERLSQATIFTRLDLRGAYNLIRMREGDEWKTTFLTRYGAYESLVMPFGLKTAPSTFAWFMQSIFHDMIDRFVIIYLDDLLIYSLDQSTHDSHVAAVLQRLRENQLYAKLEKCAFDLTSLNFLGYQISSAGITMDPTKVQAVLDWEAPSTRKGLQRFLGFANFYRKFLPNFSHFTAPLTDLLKGPKSTPLKWSSVAQTAFDTLKKAFSSEPLLVHPDQHLPFVVQTDASNVALGAVLLQREGVRGSYVPVLTIPGSYRHL